MTNISLVPPKRPAPAKPRVRRKKAAAEAPRVVEHKIFGLGTVISVRQLSGGSMAADVEFKNAGRRTVCLLPQFWVSDVPTALAA